MKISMIFSSLYNYFQFFHQKAKHRQRPSQNSWDFDDDRATKLGAVTRLFCFEKFADFKPEKWRSSASYLAIIWPLSARYLTIRWLIGRILIGDKHILSGCTGHPDKRDKGAFGTRQNKIHPDKRYQRQNKNGKP